MHRSLTATLVVVFVASLLMPFGTLQASDEGILSTQNDVLNSINDARAGLRTIEFDDPVDTSTFVPEYPLISRALILPGGSIDVDMGDVNGDEFDDLIVAVAGEDNYISIFYGRNSGEYPSYASFNISLSRTPISVLAVDDDGSESIAVLERRASSLESDCLELYSYNSATDSYDPPIRRDVYSDDAIDMVAGKMSGDTSEDIVIVCGWSDSSTTLGYIEVKYGDDYSERDVFPAGNGTNALTTGDFNDDGLTDIAATNLYDSNVAVFYQPFGDWMEKDLTLAVSNSPVGLAAGRLNADETDDLAVCTADESSIVFFYQAGEMIPTPVSCLLQFQPSKICSGDLSGDSNDDLLILSRESNVAIGLIQQDEGARWSSIHSYSFPTGAGPRNALICDINSDSEPDVIVASAHEELVGSSISLYLSTGQNHSNCNLTLWTNQDYRATMIASGDINGDDYADAVLLYPDIGAFAYSLSFSGTLTTMALGFTPGKMVIEDFDQDGYSDILVTELAGSSISVSMGAENLPAGFVLHELAGGGNITEAVTGDFNNDGKTDFIVATDNDELELYPNEMPSTVFGEPSIITLLSDVPISSIVVGDFNSDGLDDIAYAGVEDTISVNLQRENHATPFEDVPDFNLIENIGCYFERLLSGDVTGDGRSDILGYSSTDKAIIIFSQTDFEWATVKCGFIDLAETPCFIGLFDVTDDAEPDLMVTYESANLLFLYRQSEGNLPTAPSMTFVTGALPVQAIVADGSQDHRGDLVVCDSESHSISIWEQLNFAPIAHSGGPYVSQQGDALIFNGSATTGSTEIPFMEYCWDFGDGSPVMEWAREPNPSHVYEEIDVFEVIMGVRDPLGLNDTASTTVTVVDSSPHVGFTMFPSVPLEGDAVRFNDTTTSYDPVVWLNWSVDGISYSGDTLGSISVVFDNGLHSVTLEATDNDGSVSNYTLDFEVLSKNPDATLIAPTTADEGAEIVFSVVVDHWNGGPWDDIVSYEWNFSYCGGEFKADVITLVNTTSRVFSADGDSEKYSVAVRVTDIDGNHTLCIVDMTILDIGPDASLILSDDTPGEGLPFSFIATDSYDGVIDWAWTITGPDGYIESFNLTADEMAAVDFVLADGAYHMQLEITESDGDTDEFTLNFDVAELPPSVTLLTVPNHVTFFEFTDVEFATIVESYDDIAGFEWDFISYGGEFIADESSDGGTISHVYSWVGNYTAKVRVTDTEEMSAIAFTTIEITDRDLAGTFDEVIVTRDNPDDTSIVTFNASYFAEAFPDISNVLWEFGDGFREIIFGAPSQPMSHTYSPIRNYVLNLTLTDDDGNVLSMSKELLLIQPVIEMISPSGDNVINPGVPIRFLISDDSLPLVSVTYSIDGDEEQNFTSQYEVDTTGWADDVYLVTVRAEDIDGNIAILRNLYITIDSEVPAIILLSPSNQTYSGDRLNITIEVDDANVDFGAVTLFTRFPGDESPSSTVMKHLDNGRFYAVVHVPMRTGTLEFWFTAEDLAGNSVTSEIFTMAIEMHFIDAAWPYLLALAVLAAFGTAAYFVREAKTAVDETFVIYHDGRLMAHSTRRLKPGMDDQVLGSMFVAIQDFVMDSFKDETSFTLRKLDFGEKAVLVERGDRVFLAAVLHGRSSRKVVSRMKKVVGEIEKHFEPSLVDWDGNLDEVRGVNDLMKKLYSRMPAFPGTQKRS